MSKPDIIPIGRGVSEYYSGQPFGIDFRPGATPGEARILVWDGSPGPGRTGGDYTAAQMLEPRFRSDFVRAQAEWFRPLVEDLARGRNVTAHDIERARPAAP